MKYFLIVLTFVFSSMYYFPFEFTFLRGINTKHMMFVLGSLCLSWDILCNRSITFNKELIIGSIFALIFSICGLFSNDLNNTSDYAYTIYLGSMWMWLIACYGACCFMKLSHGYISVKLIINYLLAICVFQCIIALLIDFIPSVKTLIDSFFVTGEVGYMERINRLYGIGASLDVAGVRFACVLVLAAVILCEDKLIRNNNNLLIYYIFSFLIIGVIGNMIARTTTVGLGLGLAYIIFRSGILSINIKIIDLKLWKILFSSTLFIVIIATYLYYNNPDFYDLIRFAFEGFFNWVETGKWETDSTEVLKNMWVFPENIKTWIIGDGYFNNPITGGYYMGTDVGYLRFIFYSGLIGLFSFSIFFIYLSLALSIRFKYIKYVFFLLLIIVFVNWIKVATDIFLVYAFFLCISQPYFSPYYKKDFEAI